METTCGSDLWHFKWTTVSLSQLLSLSHTHVFYFKLSTNLSTTHSHHFILSTSLSAPLLFISCYLHMSAVASWLILWSSLVGHAMMTTVCVCLSVSLVFIELQGFSLYPPPPHLHFSCSLTHLHHVLFPSLSDPSGVWGWKRVGVRKKDREGKRYNGQ